MKKDRNSFFQSSNFNLSANNNPMPMPYQNPMPNVMANSSYYQSNYPLYADNMPMNMNEIETRIAKLESNGNTTFTNDTYSADGNMYMV